MQAGRAGVLDERRFETGCFDFAQHPGGFAQHPGDFAQHPGDFAQHPGDVEVGISDFDL